MLHNKGSLVLGIKMQHLHSFSFPKQIRPKGLGKCYYNSKHDFFYVIFQIINAKKSCQITSWRQVICKEFWHEWFRKPYTHISDLTVFTLWKLQICKKLWNCSKMMVFFMFTLCKVSRKTHAHTLQQFDNFLKKFIKSS